MWKKCIQTLLPAPFHHPSLLGMHLQKVWAEWQLTAPKGAGTVVCLPFSTPCMPFPLHWLWGMISILVSRFALLNLQKKQYWKKVGMQIVGWLDVLLHITAWCADLAQGDIRRVPVQGQRRGQDGVSHNGEGRAALFLLAAACCWSGSALIIRPRSQDPCCHPVLLGKNVVNPKVHGRMLHIS